MVSLSPLTILDVRAQTENTWTSLAPLQQPREGLGVAVVNGKTYALGGSNPGPIGPYQDVVNEEYDPITNTWTYKKPIPTPMAYFVSVVYQNKIYCIGNENGAVEVYDPSTDTWENKTPLPDPRQSISGVVIDNKIYVVGGVVSTLNVYDIPTDTWSTKANMLVAPSMTHTWTCTTVAFDGRMHVIGAFPFANSHQIYDPQTDEWILGEPLIDGYYFAVAGATTGTNAPDRIYVYGTDASSWPWNPPRPTAQIYDPITEKWSLGIALPTVRMNSGITVLNDMIYVIGGSTFGYFNMQGTSAVNERFTPVLYGSIPQISITSPENMIYTQTTIPLEFTVNEPTSWIGYTLGGQPNVTITENTNLTILTEGRHTIGLYARDMAGDEGSTIVTFTVDVNPPIVFVLSPENKTYSDSNILLNVEFEEEISDMKYSLDGLENVTFTENITVSELKVGAHNVTVYAIDLAGHTGVSETIYFTIEPFPTILVIASVVIIAVDGVVIFVYLVKKRRNK